MLALLKLRYVSLCANVELKEFEIPKNSLSDYKLIKNKKGNNTFTYDNEPPQKYRVIGDELKSAKEIAGSKQEQ